jgi:hypothetical protein
MGRMSDIRKSIIPNAEFIIDHLNNFFKEPYLYNRSGNFINRSDYAINGYGNNGLEMTVSSYDDDSIDYIQFFNFGNGFEYNRVYLLIRFDYKDREYYECKIIDCRSKSDEVIIKNINNGNDILDFINEFIVILYPSLSREINLYKLLK